jgi:hypothetical protein
LQVYAALIGAKRKNSLGSGVVAVLVSKSNVVSAGGVIYTPEQLSVCLELQIRHMGSVTVFNQ